MNKFLPCTHLLYLGREWQIEINVLPKDITPAARLEQLNVRFDDDDADYYNDLLYNAGIPLRRVLMILALQCITN